MKKLIFMLLPLIVLALAFHPVGSHTITGKVTDTTGQPLAGAVITEKGTVNSTTTKSDGSFSLVASDGKATIVVTGLGYEPQEIKVKGRFVINATLKPAKQALDEVVVTAYSKANRKDMSYSLQGRVSGVTIAGAPGYDDRKSEDFNTEGYDFINENRFLKATDNPLSTFSIDVDAASYSNMRRFLNQGQLPPAGAVRIEEMINYFTYDYPQPAGNDPFSINTEISDAPWNKNHKLVLIGLQGKKIPTGSLPASNLTFLIDVSGSMSDPNKLPLVKASMKLLVDQLREQDKVSIVVYAGAAGLVLPPTSGAEKTKIKDAIDNLEAGGSTAGGAGIKLAYKTAREHFAKGGNNRVILCTDGDFNVGASSDDDMERLIETERKSGVFLTVLGYGMGNYKDNKMQKLADKGNGNHAYIDGMSEARKVLVNEFGGTLFTIAKDVKLQVEFNPAKVQGYRLIGYENRMLVKEDFNNDKKDAGELGSGHTVTALYEVIPVGIDDDFLEEVDKLKYQQQTKPSSASNGNEILTVKFRYKAPDGEVSKLITHPVADKAVSLAKTSANFRFAAAVAEMGLLLRNSEFKGDASFANVIKLASHAKGVDEEGYRSEFIRLAESARTLARSNGPVDEEEEGLSVNE